MLREIFHASFRRDSSRDRGVLDALSSHPAMQTNAELVYIYSLGRREAGITYPQGLGRVVYIGQTQRLTGSGKRFRNHISKSMASGLSTNINHTLSVYYHRGCDLDLRVFTVGRHRTPGEVERILLRTHLHIFGAYPIGQGSTGRANAPAVVARMVEESSTTYRVCAKLLGRRSRHPTRTTS